MAREKVIEIDTRLGRRAIDPEKIIHFPRGLAGFENEHDFILLQLQPDAPLLILQSIKRPEVGLLVADPYSFLESFPILLGEAEKDMLKLDNVKEGALLVTVSIPDGKPQDAMLNLAGPIIINYQVRIGLQVPQNFDGPSQISMHKAAEEAAARKEAECVAG